MALLDVVTKAKTATEGLADMTEAKVKGWVGDFKRAVAVLETVGFRMGTFTIGMGGLPEIRTSLEGSIENLHEDRLQRMIDEHKTEELLVSLLKTLIWVRWGWQHMESKLTSVTLHVTLGIAPGIRAEIH